MSFTRSVPAEVPSLLQSSVPLVPSFAEKNKVPFTSVSEAGDPPTPKGWISFTCSVPSGVPSLFQSALATLKKSVSFTAAGNTGSAEGGPRRKKPIRATVPSGVPSLFQSSRVLRWSMLRKSVSPRAGEEDPSPRRPAWSAHRRHSPSDHGGVGGVNPRVAGRNASSARGREAGRASARTRRRRPWLGQPARCPARRASRAGARLAGLRSAAPRCARAPRACVRSAG
jgi:hypothetical protein